MLFTLKISFYPPYAIFWFRWDLKKISISRFQLMQQELMLCSMGSSGIENFKAINFQLVQNPANAKFTVC